MFSSRSNSGGVTLLLLVCAGLVLFGGYSAIYPHALDFATSRPAIPVSDRERAAKYFAIIWQMLVLHFLFCCGWSFNLLQTRSINTSAIRISPWFPVCQGLVAFPMIYAFIFVLF